MGAGLLRTIAKQDDARGSLVELLAHFFAPLHPHCPACGAVDCEHWLLVRELAPPGRSTLDAIAGAGVTPR